LYNVRKEKALPQVKVKKPVKATAKKPTGKAVKKVTLDDINANFERIQKAHEETEKALKESIEENRKTLNEAIGGLGNTIGNISESMLVPNLVEKFKKLGFTFEITNRHRKIVSDEHDIHTEIDAFLENGSQAMAVEVKTTLRRDEVDYHVERMEKIRRHADLHNDKRQFLGAIAATVIDEETRRYTLKQGFYIIEPSGEDVKIVKPASAKIW
jgi:glutamyl-tRNA reductase